MIHNITGKGLSQIQNVFIDLDGTISKSGDGCINGVKYMFECIGFMDYDETTIQSFVGPSVKVHLKDAYGFSQEQADEAYVYYREYFDQKGIYETSPYTGIVNAIEAMRSAGKATYVATLKPEDQALSVIERFGIKELFNGIFGARHDLGIFYKEGVLERAVEIIGQTPVNSVMVGDRHHDVLAGLHMEFDTVGVLYGYGDFDELKNAGCDIIAETVGDLAALLGEV